MLVPEEYKIRVAAAEEEVARILEAMDLEKVRKELDDILKLTESQDFWNDPANTKTVLSRQSSLKNKLAEAEKLKGTLDDAVTMLELAEELDDDMTEEIEESLKNLESTVEKQRLATLLTGEYDSKNCILTLHAGAGGTEAQDWAEMLYRMYTRFCTAEGFKVNVIDYLDGDEAGIKTASIQIEGENAYGYLKSEHGVHRLVRVSPFDASGRRHTSFASVEVMPDIGNDTTIVIRDEDIKMDVYRSSGAGGQKVNKTSSAVRLTHIPTGIVVACQNERSQYQNRDVAMSMLKAKLLKIKEQQNLEKIEDIKGDQMQIGWGSQIRSYVFMPYTLVKDHRTNYETGNIAAVMDGDLEGFINAYLIMQSKEKKGN
ncbi:MAG: peptide chain release factor 2 [Mogibacterium sp.]|nr:peptide chain release factor 2 [Oscillospiraceae bacterium]MBR3125773.1 peptide chain release factor 2 [Mogibacterium sp.]